MKNPQLTQAFAALESGDKIKVPQYATPLAVTEILDSVGIVELEGSRGGSKSLVQNENRPEDIALLSGATREGFVNEIEVVN